MTNPFALGFVAVFNEPLNEALLRYVMQSWLERYGRVEQVLQRDVATTHVEGPDDVCWEKNLQFRILNGDEFAWVYITRDSKVIETTGIPKNEDVSLCLDLLIELPGLREIVPDNDEARLTQLEAEGLL